jgi:hypothetical protein
MESCKSFAVPLLHVNNRYPTVLTFIDSLTATRSTDLDFYEQKAAAF